jgi:hypothetical protein
VPGVAALLKAIKAAADRRNRPCTIHFISASPPQIGKAIRDKLALDGVPYDGIVFKNQLQHIARGRFRNLREHVGFKLRELLVGRLGSDGPVQELLFGDDWESDPLTYSLYADIVAGRLPIDRLGELLGRIGVDPGLAPAVLDLSTQAAGLHGVERIFINLERRTPPAFFDLFGPRLVPTFNYFQTALVMAADGYLGREDVAGIAAELTGRFEYTARRLENSLADLLRRNLLSADAADHLTAPMRARGLLPEEPRRGRGRLRRWVTRAWRTLRRRTPPPPQAGPLEFEAILDRMRQPRLGRH